MNHTITFCHSRQGILSTILRLVCTGAFSIALSAVLHAQTAGQGAIQGTVLDTSGAAVPNAKITATNIATGIATVRTASGSGVFTIAPLIPGTYSLRVEASGFQTLLQDNLVVNALQTLGINPTLTVGATTESVTVTAAPPPLNTTNAVLGLVMENETYSNLPIQMNNAQRDPTAFASLAPGAQTGIRTPIIGGTGNYLAEAYLDGVPVTTINQQGDNRLISLGLSVEAVDQFQVVTSTPPAEYQGAGIVNFTMKSGTSHYHGQASTFVRNTIFDTWCYTCKLPNALGQMVKPVERQIEISASAGGPIPLTHGKGFVFFAYDKFHSRRGANPVFGTVPTELMRTGDFTELGSNPILYNPTTNSCTGSTCTRQPFQGMKNGVPTYNVIPPSYLSPIAQYMQQFLPAPNSPGVANNYYGGLPSGFDNHLYDARIDYDLTSRQRISGVLAIGSVDYEPLNPITASGSVGALDGPYTQGDLAVISPRVFDVEHSYAISERVVNQFKFGFTRFSQIITNYTQNVTPWMATTIGITNLPPGQASEQFPGAAFSTSALFGTGYVPTQWTYNGASTATQTTIPNAYTLVDNVQWTKGRHNFTFGLTMQWLQNNNAAQLGPSSIFVQTYNANSTANLKGNAIDSTTSGHPYASYMLGAVGGSPSITLQAVSETGGRYRTTSPYFQDDWKITPTLTVNLGVRWDYFPPYREAKDRMSFLNPGITNPATGNLGALQFAGDFGGAASCHCSTPVNTYWRNWGPRVGLAWQVDDKTVFRGGGAIVYSRAGGVGGRAGAGNGTGQLGFNVNAQAPAEITTGVTSGPSYYLNNGAYFNSIGLGNTAYGGPTYVLPSNPGPSTASQILSAGNYLNSSGSYVTPSTITFADPYISGRAPVFNFWNFGMERAITSNMTIGVNYVGSQSHFVVSSANNPRGYWTNQLNPAYLAAFIGVSDSTGTQSILRAPATPANIAKAQSVISSIALPYPAFGLAAGKNSNATIAQMLTAFPQYSGVSDIWGNNVANLSYNAFQLALQQRLWRGLTFNINYTFSKNLGDDGTFRSGFDIPASALSGSGQSWHMNRIERSWTTVSTPQSLHLFGVYQLPFGDQIGTNNWAVRNLAGGWQLSWIYTYSSGIPLAITFGGCTAPGLGQCMPDLNPDSPAYLKRNARINGSWGRAPGGNTAATLAKVQYIDVNAFKAPQTFGFGAAGTSNPINLIGNAPRTKPLNLSLPSTQELDMAVRRTFNLPKSMKIMIEADCLNVPNKVTFGNNSASGVNQSWSAGSTSFGTITAASSNSRDWQLAGHFIF